MIAGGASAVAAVLVALRNLAGEGAARASAPFLAFAPAAVWVATSADAFFTGVAAWGVTLVVLATGSRDRRSDLLALGGGVVLGIALFLSYGMVLIGLVAAAVAVARRRLRPLLITGVGVGLVSLIFAAGGFWWPEGLRATHLRYLAGISRRRPYEYFLLGNLAALAIALGPVAALALVRLRDRRVWFLAGGALVAVALADLSGLSKGEVERIWLPFMPWILVATCALPGRVANPSSAPAPLAPSSSALPPSHAGLSWLWARPWLALHVLSGLILQVGIHTPW